MAILNTGHTFVDEQQVTSDRLNNIANAATFTDGAVDGTTTQVSSGAIIVRDLGISTGKIATSAVTTAKLATDSVSTAKIIDSNVTKAKIENFTNLTVLGNVSGSAATPSEVVILDEDNMASDSATSLSTQQSIKAYVDTQIGSNNELSEVLANGNITGTNNIIVTAGQSITTDTVSETTAAAGVTVDSVLIKDGNVTGNLTGDVTGDVTGNINGTVGATTPASVAATTISATGGITSTAALNTFGGTAFNSQNVTGIQDISLSAGTASATAVTIGNPVSSLCPQLTMTRQGGSTSTNDFIKLDTSAGEVASIDASGGAFFAGNVGIGTLAPLGHLHINTESAEATEVYIDGESSQQKSVELRHYDASEASGAGRNTFYLKTKAADKVTLGGYNDSSSEFEVVTFQENGNVGIGTVPDEKLHVAGNIMLDNNTALKSKRVAGNAFNLIGINNTGQGCIEIGEASTIPDGMYIYTPTDTGQGVTFHNGTDPLMYVRNDGNVGIGTTAPGVPLHIASSGESKLDLEDTGGQRYRLFARNSDDVFGIYDVTNSDTWFRYTGNSTIGSTKLALLEGGGNVGIGTTSPSYQLDVNGTGRFTSTVRFDGNTANYAGAYDIYRDNAGYLRHRIADKSLYIGVTNTAGVVHYPIVMAASSDVLIFNNEEGEMARFDTSGNLGIGNNAPSVRVEIGDGTGTDHVYVNKSGSGAFPGTTDTTSHGIMLESQGSAGSTIHVSRTDSAAGNFSRQGTGDVIIFNNTSSSVTEAGSIEITGATSVAYRTSSDYRLKENVVDFADSIDRVKQLNPVRFNFIGEDPVVDGFLAHEVQDIVPEAIGGTKDAMKDEEYEVSPAVYEDVVHPAVEAVYDEDGQEITPAQEKRTESVLVTEAVTDTRSVPDYQGIDQSKLVPLLTAALQEAISKIESLEARMQTLEG